MLNMTHSDDVHKQNCFQFCYKTFEKIRIMIKRQRRLCFTNPWLPFQEKAAVLGQRINDSQIMLRSQMTAKGCRKLCIKNVIIPGKK